MTRNRRGLWLGGLAVVLVALAVSAAWWLRPLWRAGAERLEAALAPAPSPDDATGTLTLARAAFVDLPGWDTDELSKALPALLLSCRRIASRPPAEELGAVAGRAGEWQPACAAAAEVPAGDDVAARAFFETFFLPLAAADGGAREGLFTGYYEPTLRGSRRRRDRFQIPLYRRPPELVAIDLGRFREELRGQRIAGRIVDGALVPFADRRAIDRGALAGCGLELVWVDDPVDAFFLHIQGSGRVELAEGGVMRVGYADQNGHPYRAIGRDLVERQALTKEEVSMQSIRRWLAENPGEAAEVMAKNASYVFFQQLKGSDGGPLGAQGVALTGGRSLAVDPSHLAYGTPVWLDATAPSPAAGEPDRPLRRLLVAQDTGGAIRGPVRGDVFWGHGEEAAEIAGRMKHKGRIWLLLPHGPAHRAAP